MQFVPSLLAAAVLAAPMTAQGQVILGRVYEEGRRTPVASAQIALLSADGRERSSTLTDSAGEFRVVPAVPGRYTLRVQHIAYAEYLSEVVDVERSETVELEIRLGRTVIPLQPLLVTARTRDTGRMTGFNERMRSHSFGRFMTRSEIERRAGGRTTDLLRTVPGVSVVPIRIRGRSGPERYMVSMRNGSATCQPAIYVDGVIVRQYAESTVDDMLSPDVLEGVEIYTSSAGAPAQYTESGTCGVILFWTRQGEGGAKFSWKRLLIGVGTLGAVILLIR
jgi:hypothetical protein